MEMERESEDLEVEESSELEVRRRRTNGTNGGAPPEGEQKAEVGGGEAELRTVYYDADQGVWKCRHCTWTYQLIGPDSQCFDNHDGSCEVVMDVKSLTLLESLYDSSCKAQYTLAVEISNTKPKRDEAIVIQEELANGNSDFKTNMVNGQKDITSEEAYHVTKSTDVENGSNSQWHSKTNGGETTEIEDEITVHEQTTVLRTKLKAADIDLERILEEQDTHDLYCPNCNSCITKRVILRKRKRPVRERDLPSKKPHEEEHSSRNLVNETTADGKTNLVDASEPDPDVFRCLSCFSFFIPTDGGFNIFRIFEKGKENHVKVSEPVPEKKSNWFLSLFEVDKSTKKGSEPGISEPTESYIITSAVGDSIQKQKENSHPSSTPGILTSGQSQIIYQNNGTGASLTEESRQTGERLALSGDATAIKRISHSYPTIQGSEASATEVVPRPYVQIDVADRTGRDSEISNGWDILKSIVYGGLMESITSLAVVSAAAGADASTLSIIGLGLANLIGGLLIIVHNLFELRTAQDEATEHVQHVGRYWELLGRRANFCLHFIVAVISYILVGLVPPVVYGFSFRKSGDKDYKLIAVTAASLLCIALLAVGKAHVKPQKAYIKTLFYYLSLGISSSAISCIAGVLISRLLNHLGWFDQSTASSSFATLNPREVNSRGSAWASY